jgi:hypothetical protein
MTATVYGPGTSKKEKGKIVNKGMGGFLCPPGHPEHSYSVETDLRRRPENRGSMSLSAAVNYEWLDNITRHQAGQIIDKWNQNRPAIDSAEVKDWIQQVLGYFRGCYKNPKLQEPDCWAASVLSIDQDNKADPMTLIDYHAGVHLIRRYYPEYVPTADDFASAYWGTKKEEVTA